MRSFVDEARPVLFALRRVLIPKKIYCHLFFLILINGYGPKRRSELLLSAQ